MASSRSDSVDAVIVAEEPQAVPTTHEVGACHDHGVSQPLGDAIAQLPGG
jgi:hypothetical protein